MFFTFFLGSDQNDKMRNLYAEEDDEEDEEFEKRCVLNCGSHFHAVYMETTTIRESCATWLYLNWYKSNLIVPIADESNREWANVRFIRN